jgi:hypothetical protein
MHRLAVKLGATRRGTIAAGGKRTMIALAIIEIVIDVAVEVISPVIPGTGTNKYAA